jgi:ABC-2 type transport system ATP-binding protein
MNAIELTHVAKRYGAVDALADLTLDVQRGEMFGLIGPDGAGKTTAIRIMCGLLHPDGGQVRVLGVDPARNRRAIAQGVGYLSQRFSLYGDLTIDENIAFFANIHGVHHYQRRRDQLLEMTRLTPFRTRRADRLSGGMKQKLALACTLVHEPSLIILDEPTTGVDPVSRREFWKLLSESLANGITILMSTPGRGRTVRPDRARPRRPHACGRRAGAAERRRAFARGCLHRSPVEGAYRCAGMIGFRARRFSAWPRR